MIRSLYNNNVYESIDALMLTYMEVPKGISIYEYLIIRKPVLVLITLKAPTNKPSKHDLMLINTVNQEIHHAINNRAGHYWLDTYNSILSVYKERK